jgi:hypothetical protein
MLPCNLHTIQADDDVHLGNRPYANDCHTDEFKSNDRGHDFGNFRDRTARWQSRIVPHSTFERDGTGRIPTQYRWHTAC